MSYRRHMVTGTVRPHLPLWGALSSSQSCRICWVSRQCHTSIQTLYISMFDSNLFVCFKCLCLITLFGHMCIKVEGMEGFGEEG